MELLVLPEGLRYCKWGHISERGKDCLKCSRIMDARRRRTPHRRETMRRVDEKRRAEGRTYLQRYPAVRRIYNARWVARYPEKAAAQEAVHRAERRGNIVRPVVCTWCDVQPVAHAHHYLGYAPEHWLDVEYLCHKCHGLTRRKNGRINSRAEWQQMVANVA
jgi:hypothetical protein